MLSQNLFLNFEFDLEKGSFTTWARITSDKAKVGLSDPDSSTEIEILEPSGIDWHSISQPQSSLKRS